MLMTAALVALLVGCGFAIATEHSKVLFATLGFAGMVVLAATQRGALVGLLMLAVMNGLPFVDTATTVSGKIALQDLAVIVLMLTAGAWILLDGTFHCPSR